MSVRGMHDVADDDTQTAEAAVVHANGARHVESIWSAGRSKVARCDDDKDQPLSSVMIAPHVERSTNVDEIGTSPTRTGSRCIGAEPAPVSGRRNTVPEQRPVRAAPTRVVSRAARNE